MTLPRKHPSVKKAHEAMRKAYPKEEDRLTLYGTLLGCAMEVGEYLLQHHNPNELPREVAYAMSVLYNNYLMTFKPEKQIVGNIADRKFQDNFEQKTLDEKFAISVQQLYDSCVEFGLIKK